MPSVEQSRQSIRDWIRSIFVGSPVLIENYNSGQPNEPYFTVKLIHTKWYPHSIKTIVNDTDETVKLYVKLFFSIQAIGKGDPESKLHRLIASLESTKGELFMYGRELGYCGITTNIINIGAPVGSEWEDRSSMTATFDARIDESFITEFADHCEIDIIADNGVSQEHHIIRVPGE